jgi:hypothetical protein
LNEATAAPALPAEAIHLPFEAGPYRMAMGLVAVPASEWFELDQHYHRDVTERRQLLLDCHELVFGALPGSEAARRETLEIVAEHLTARHPAAFTRRGTTLTNHLTGDEWDLASPEQDHLHIAGLLVQEDLCIVQVDEAGHPLFTAAVLCFPSRWRLHEKLGHALPQVHDPVPLYAGRLARPVDRFMRNIKPGHIAMRLNWSVVDSPAMFQPEGKWRDAPNHEVTAENAGRKLHLRVERQTLTRLPRSGPVLFGIRVHSYPLGSAIRGAAEAARLAAAVRALPEEITLYKSLRPVRAALLEWLDGYDQRALSDSSHSRSARMRG